jgi:hypothetical protein
MTTDVTSDPGTESAPLRLRFTLIALAVVYVWLFFLGNSRSEEFRLDFPRFEPWLWNLYLTCVPVALVGMGAMWWRRPWGYWTLLTATVLATLIGVYAMGFTLIGAGIVLAFAAVWIADREGWSLERSRA